MTAKKPKTKRRTSDRPKKKTRNGPGALTEIAIAALEDMKAVNVKVLDVRKLTDVTDTMIVATGTPTGTSSRSRTPGRALPAGRAPALRRRGRDARASGCWSTCRT